MATPRQTSAIIVAVVLTLLFAGAAMIDGFCGQDTECGDDVHALTDASATQKMDHIQHSFDRADAALANEG